jgi:hypothetical protein
MNYNHRYGVATKKCHIHSDIWVWFRRFPLEAVIAQYNGNVSSALKVFLVN